MSEHTQTDGDVPDLNINVGSLRDLDSLRIATAPQLRKFSGFYQRGIRPRVAWDLRGVEPGKMNLAALTAFLSVAERMRAFSDQPQVGWVGFKPRVFGFWHDIAFLQWIRVLDLIRWQPPDIVGGYGQYVSQTNPNTKILRFACPDPLPVFRDESEFEGWKNDQRERHVEALRSPCGAVFYRVGDRGGATRSVFENVVYAVAELITNSHYWGRAPAYIGLQRSTAGISVAACDTGHGFVSALSRKRLLFGRGPAVDRHVDALIVGSLINSELYGLRRAIQSVVDSRGWVTVASFDAVVTGGCPQLASERATAAKNGIKRMALSPFA